MRLKLGTDFFEARNGRAAPLYYDTSKLTNGHMLLLGSTGVGKSYRLINLLEQATREGKQLRFHVFDVHGDLEIPGASVIEFSEFSPFGLNPFLVNPNPKYGGVRKAIRAFIRILNQASATKLGVRQEAVLRAILTDVYLEFGFDPDIPESWALNEYEVQMVGGGNNNRVYLEVPFAEKDQVQKLGARWDGAKKHWWVQADAYKGDLLKWKPAYKARRCPSLKDVLEHCKNLYTEMTSGSSQKAVRALEVANKKAQALQRKVMHAIRDRHFYEPDIETKLELKEAGQAAIEAYTEYVNAIQTGKEHETLTKYDSAETVKSLQNRLENLLGTGIFKENFPKFDADCPIWRYHLNALSNEERKMFVLFKLEEIYYKMVERGAKNDVVEVLVLDELGTYCSSADNDNGDGIIGVISREARKYGLALWGAHQEPDGVPKSLITACATKIIVGLDEGFWKAAVPNLRIETRLLEWISPRKTMAVQFKEVGATKNRWWWVQL
jgi:hypothetical protein